MKDKKTTGSALAALAVALITLVIDPLVDGDPATKPQLAAFVPIALTTLIGIFAADSAKPPEPPKP